MSGLIQAVNQQILRDRLVSNIVAHNPEYVRVHIHTYSKAGANTYSVVYEAYTEDKERIEDVAEVILHTL